MYWLLFDCFVVFRFLFFWVFGEIRFVLGLCRFSLEFLWVFGFVLKDLDLGLGRELNEFDLELGFFFDLNEFDLDLGFLLEDKEFDFEFVFLFDIDLDLDFCFWELLEISGV